MLEHLYFTGTSLFLKLTLQACDNALVTIKTASRKAEVVIALGEQQQDLFIPHHDAACCMSTEYSALFGFQLGVNNFSYELHVVSLPQDQLVIVQGGHGISAILEILWPVALAQRSSNTGKVDVRSIVVVVLPTRNCLMRECPYAPMTRRSMPCSA